MPIGSDSMLDCFVRAIRRPYHCRARTWFRVYRSICLVSNDTRAVCVATGIGCARGYQTASNHHTDYATIVHSRCVIVNETATVDVFVNKVRSIPICLCCARFAARSLLSVTIGDYTKNEISAGGCICSLIIRKFGPILSASRI